MSICFKYKQGAISSVGYFLARSQRNERYFAGISKIPFYDLIPSLYFYLAIPRHVRTYLRSSFLDVPLKLHFSLRREKEGQAEIKSTLPS